VASHYGTTAEATIYFGERLNTIPWDNAIPGDRVKALYMATRAIDKLNIAGEKLDDDQELQFPRVGDSVVPTDIKLACFECAFAFLDGVDMELEQKNLGMTSDAFSGARTTYDSYFVEEHIRAGIPSSEAWAYLYPYLRDPRELIISRVP
jgi:hypothetical protein